MNLFGDARTSHEAIFLFILLEKGCTILVRNRPLTRIQILLLIVLGLVAGLKACWLVTLAVGEACHA